MPKLRARLLGVMTTLTAATLVLFGCAVYLVARAALWRSLDDSLVRMARTEIGSATDLSTIHLHEPDPRPMQVSGASGYEKYAWIVDGSGRVVAHTANVRPAEVGAIRPRTLDVVFGFERVDGTVLRMVFHPFRDESGRSYVCAVGVPEEVVSAFLSRILQIVVAMSMLGTLLAFVVADFLAKSLTRPLLRLAEDAEQIDPGSPAPERLIAPYEEIHGLSSAINRLVGKVAQMLDERNRTIEAQRQFVADASHELRTPVSNIQGTIEVALRRPRTPCQYRDSLETSLGEVRRMGRLVQDLLLLAKADLDRLPVRLGPTDLSAVVHDSIASLDPDAAQGLELTVEIPKAMPALADRDRVREAIDNLVRNALAHASRRIRISAESVGGNARISVANDGPPLSPEESERVFERFFRSDASRARDTGGSGLGLAIVRSIAQGHGGTTTAMSDGEWVTFTFAIPTGETVRQA